MVELKVLVGKRLKELRLHANLTQEKLAEKAEVSADFISMIERGLRSPSLETIEKLSLIFNIEPADLFKFDK